MKKVLWWIKRDIRSDDNAVFQKAASKGAVIPVFIFVPSLLESFPQNDRRLGFISEALDVLEKNLGTKVYRFYGEPEEVFSQLLEEAEGIVTAKVHSTTMKKHEKAVHALCQARGKGFERLEETLLIGVDELQPYKVFTPYFKAWQKIPKIPPLPAIKATFAPLTTTSFNVPFSFPNTLPFRAHERDLSIDLPNYAQNRNDLGLTTSQLSGHIRFGTVGIRTLFDKAQSAQCETFMSELAWREFWFQIAHYFPDTLKTEFLEKRRGLAWENNEEHFRAWCEGETGYPVIDAAMRELNTTGFMHGRARMIVASFLTKDLLIDWRWGEEYFREKLWDYDEAVNIGNWQWSASVGADPKPLRIFNPILQAQKYDSQALYIKKWLPELSFIEAYKLHDPLKYALPWHKPIVHHAIQQARAKAMYANQRGIGES